MKSLLIIDRIKVENANAISGLTYGFPAMTHFLGFTHALSRQIKPKFNVTLDRCGVVCHTHQVKAHQPKGWGDYVFSLNRNPLTKEGKTAPFIEEGKMHIEVSLSIEVNGYLSDDGFEDVIEFIQARLLAMRLAGGDVISYKNIAISEFPKDIKHLRKCLFSLLPGFALVDRSELLEHHYQVCQAETPPRDRLDAWLDFAALKYQAIPEDSAKELDENTPARWEYISKPGAGYLVPIMVGYKGISNLYAPGEVANTRDSTTPFRFVESAYGVGQWLSPHRIKNIEDLLWSYHVEDDWYLCKQSHNEQTAPSI